MVRLLYSRFRFLDKSILVGSLVLLGVHLAGEQVDDEVLHVLLGDFALAVHVGNVGGGLSNHELSVLVDHAEDVVEELKGLILLKLSVLASVVLFPDLSDSLLHSVLVNAGHRVVHGDNVLDFLGLGIRSSISILCREDLGGEGTNESNFSKVHLLCRL